MLHRVIDALLLECVLLGRGAHLDEALDVDEREARAVGEVERTNAPALLQTRQKRRRSKQIARLCVALLVIACMRARG
jgi:hypothetical protein